MANIPITRDKALSLLVGMDQKSSDMNHYLETEAIMRTLAAKSNEDVAYWGMVGLLHDVDWAITRENVSQHCIKAVEILGKVGFDKEFIKTVQSHAYGLEEIPPFQDFHRSEKIEYCLAAAETLTGIIHAYALMRGRRISGMESKGLKKKFKDKTFAANCDRALVIEIEKTGIGIDEFFEISIEAIRGIKDEIGVE